MSTKLYLLKHCLYLTFATCVLFSTQKINAQTTLYYENFNTGGGTWTLNTSDEGSNPGDGNYWVINTTYRGGLGGTTPNEPVAVVGNPKSEYMHITNQLSGNASALAPADGDPVFTKMNVPINTIGYSNVTLTFYMLVNGEAGKYYGRIYYSTDGGTTWTWWNNQAYNGITSWTLETITSATNAFDNQADLRFAFMWVQGTDSRDQDPALAVDEITVVGTGASCPVTITGNTSTNPTCNGSGNGTINLAATDTSTGAILTYTINNGANISNGTGAFTGLAPGIYTVKVADANCTTIGKSDTIVNPAVVPAPKVGSNSPLCTGATLNLTDSTSGAKYNWTGPNSFSSAVQNPSLANVVVADSGTYTVVDTLAGCASLATTVHVVIGTALAAPKVGSNSPLCAGATLSLTDSTSGAKYNWMGPNSFTSNVQNPTRNNFVAADSGTYTVIDTLAGCVSLPATVHVAISNALPAPKVGSNSPICAGAALSLTDSTAGATYNWTGPNSFSSNVQNPSRNNTVIADSGTYTVIDTVAGCVSLPATLHVVINAIPATPKVGSNSPLCAGVTLTLADSTGSATYNWTGPNSFTSTSQNPSRSNAVVADSGTYTVVDTVAGCVSLPATVHVVINAIPATPNVGSNSPLCVGATLNLSDSTSGVIYGWTGPNSFTSPLQNPVIANTSVADSGTYTVINTVGSCSSAPASVNVVVALPPAAPVASYNPPLCTGDTLKLMASNITGATYNWTGPNNFNNQQNPVKPNATSADSGTYSVIATIGTCSSPPGTVTVSVSSSPTLGQLISNTPVCSGTSLSLGAPFIPGASYIWTGPAAFVDSAQNPGRNNVTFADSGTYTVVATFGNCTSAPTTTYVVVLQSPTPPTLNTTADTICASDSAQVCAPNTFMHYIWSNGPDTTACTVAKNAGGYWVTVTDVNGCSVISNHANISAYPVPSVSIVVQGDTLSTSGAVAYQWLLNDTPIAGATRSVYIAVVTGSYSVQITDAQGCKTTSSAAPITVTGTGINEITLLDDLGIYPNPASSVLNIRYTGTLEKSCTMVLYNLIGEKVMEDPLNFNSMMNHTLDVSHLSKGIYLLQLQTGDQVVTKKITLQ